MSTAGRGSLASHPASLATREGWDGLPVQSHLCQLIARRCRFRFQRTVDRIRSPRRIVASTLALLFFLLYLLNGIFILSSRAPADPERLRLWLSGGMLLYAIYHGVRCSWSNAVSDLQLTEAEELWLGTAPIRRSSLAIYHVNNMLLPALLKTLLLTVVLARDVQYVPLMIVGMFSALLLLENARLIIARWTASFDARRRYWFRAAATSLAAALALQWLMRLIAMTPLGSSPVTYLLHGFRALGQTAACDTIQWLALPWVAAAHLTVTESIHYVTALQLFGCFAVLPLAIMTLVHVDSYCRRMQRAAERSRLASGAFRDRRTLAGASNRAIGSGIFRRMEQSLPDGCQRIVTLMSRQWVSVWRYRATIVLSFIVPTLLCLSPLLTGSGTEQWFFIVGGIALCTMLLAPPALRIDFRRDLKRMLLLRTLPVQPIAMVLGQLALPVLITCIFQWVTLAIAAAVVAPSVAQVTLWSGVLTALAVFTFAAENALFLAYPHHQHAEGLAMMVRAKLTFLGKTTVIAIAMGLLVGYSMLCRNLLPSSLVTPAFVIGSVAAAWIAAALAIRVASGCWRRFDVALDAPPS